jgi:hypothetical protein
LNVTIANPSAASFLTVFPAGEARPTAANLNYVPGQTVPNMVIVKLGAGGQISLFNFAGNVDVIVDVAGWFPEGQAYIGLTPARLMDSRRSVAPPTTPPPTSPPETNPPATTPTAAIAPGKYVVNTQLAPGRYRMATAKSGCYWERLKGFSGAFGDIITNDFQGFTGVAIVDIAPSDVGFDFNGSCGNMKLYTSPAQQTPFFAAGAFVVGQDIPAGTYITTASNGCYWERDSGFGGSINDIITNDFVGTPGQQIVTISPSDTGFRSNDKCGTWILNG